MKNCILKNDKQNYRCQSCGRQFVEIPSGHYRINDETRRLVDCLLLERLSLAKIASAAQISESCSYKYVNEQYENTPKEIDPSILLKRTSVL